MSNLLKVKVALEDAVTKLNGDYAPYQVLPAVRHALDVVNEELEANPPTAEELTKVTSDVETPAVETPENEVAADAGNIVEEVDDTLTNDDGIMGSGDEVEEEDSKKKKSAKSE